MYSFYNPLIRGVYSLGAKLNKDENVHRFALNAIRGKLLKREREKERQIVFGYHTRVTYYP